MNVIISAICCGSISLVKSSWKSLFESHIGVLIPPGCILVTLILSPLNSFPNTPAKAVRPYFDAQYMD